VCPASLKLNWRREWLKWDTKKLSVGIVGYKKDKEPFKSDVVVINYDILGKHYQDLRDIQFDLACFDECHYLKNPKTARTKQVFGSKRAGIEPIRAYRKVFLTGTPIVNRPIEIFGLLQSIDKEGLGANFMKYALRYCAAVKGRFGWDFSGASNLDELQERLRARLMVRRLKAEVLKELPPKRRQVVVLESNAKIDKLIEKEKQSYEEWEKEGGDAAVPAFAEMSAARKAVAVAKVPFAVEYIQEALDETEKIVIFAHHHEVLDALEKSFTECCARVDGRVSLDNRQAAVDRFQTDAACKVFLGGIQAAGTGLTLTAASLVIFVELDWTPGNVSQAEDRLHRIGQQDAVQVQHLVLEGSLDERMVEIIIEKQRVIDQALDTPPKKELDKPEFEADNECIPSAPPVSPPGPQRREGVGTEGVHEPDTGVLAPSEISAIHEGLKMLAAMCDGAQALDGCGFNKLDSAFGKSLAGASKLTPRMAAAGLRLVRKYKRQLSPALLERAGL